MGSEPSTTGRIIELPHLRDRRHVFADRREAGRVLAEMLADFRGSGAVLLALPAGGLPVAVEVARLLALPLDVAPTSKITLPWNSEVGYGAVGFDGTVKLNEPLLRRLGLSERTIEEGVAAARQKVRRRLADLRGEAPAPDLAGRTAILVDDGIASGFTMLVAVEAVRGAGAARVVVAVPTAHAESLPPIAGVAAEVYCANVRGGWSFAVADAYRNWRDVSEAEAARLFRQARAAGA